MKFRRAEVRDVPRLTALINTAFRKAESFFIDGDRIDAESVRTLIGKGEFLLAQENDIFVGCVYIEPRGERAYLGLLSVDPKLQGTGIGSALMKTAEEQCARAGCGYVDLKTVNLRTDNRAFYKRRGYVEAGTEPFPVEIKTKLPCHFVNLSKQLT